MRRLAAGAASLGAMGALAALAALRALDYSPRPVESVAVVREGAGRPLRRGQPFTLLCWNLQFAGSRRHHFFYDGGRAVHVPRADVDETLAGIRDALRAIAPDVALLQEVDRDAARTGRRDQLQGLLAGGPRAAWVAAPYHRCAYVPHPAHQHMGRVDLNLATLSRFPIESARRLDLPRLAEPWIRRVFNLKRAILEARIPIEGGGVLRLGNTHLSAFSRGDGTLGRQVAALEGWMERPGPAILAGDLNLLPPGDDPARLSTEGTLYTDDGNPVERLFGRWREVFGDAQLAPAHRTYQPFDGDPDRKIDYAFVREVEVLGARVLREYSEWSDHLPILARLRIPA